MAFSCNLLLLD